MALVELLVDEAWVLEPPVDEARVLEPPVDEALPPEPVFRLALLQASVLATTIAASERARPSPAFVSCALEPRGEDFVVIARDCRAAVAEPVNEKR